MSRKRKVRIPRRRPAARPDGAARVTVMRPPPRTLEYWRRRNRHRFDPFFESDGACWCGRDRRHRVHRGTARLTDTPLGRQLLDLQRRRTELR